MPSSRLLIIGVRHGRTEANEGSNTLRAWEDYPLSRNGELDADLAGNKIRQYIPTVIYHDDLIRTMQTANRISTVLGNLPTEVDYELRTADMGEWGGQPEKEVEDQVRQWYLNPWTPAPSGESYYSFTDRFYPAFDKKLDLSRRVNGYNPVVVVMHGRNFASLQSRYQFLSAEKAIMPLPGGVALFRDSYGQGITIDYLGKTEDVLTDV